MHLIQYRVIWRSSFYPSILIVTLGQFVICTSQGTRACAGIMDGYFCSHAKSIMIHSPQYFSIPIFQTTLSKANVTTRARAYTLRTCIHIWMLYNFHIISQDLEREESTSTRIKNDSAVGAYCSELSLNKLCILAPATTDLYLFGSNYVVIMR